MKNNYSSFISMNEIQQELKKVSSQNDITKGGLPICYDEEAIYLDEEYGNSLVIGNAGSGKTQSVILPKLFTSICANENIIVDDNNGEIYDIFKDKLREKEYKVLKLDFKDFNGNKWNPLKLVYDLYKDNNLDDAIMILEKVAYYLFNTENNNKADPFWKNCCEQLFAGMVLYIMEKEDRIPTILDAIDYTSKVTKEDFDKLDNNSPAKVFLRITMTAPPDTKGSIYAVFNNSIMPYSYSNKLTDFLSSSDFNIEELFDEKVALFIFNGHQKPNLLNLMSLFLEELYYVSLKKNNKRKINIIIDNFDEFSPIDNFARLLADTRSVYLEFTILIKSLHKLSELYGETMLEHIIAYFIRIIYLFATDEFTLNYISNLCGNSSVNDKLISITELKLLNTFEAIILKSRKLPFKTKLLPYYQYKNQ